MVGFSFPLFENRNKVKIAKAQALNIDLQKEEGLNVYDSVIQGSLDRLNPILMTALSSALALIPLALAGDLPGNEIQSPMAKVILGGLLTSTFLNGFIVPIVYLMMHRKKAQDVYKRQLDSVLSEGISHSTLLFT